MSKSHYDLLGASPDATQAELRRAYLKRARELHPDQFVDHPEAERAQAERKMQDVNVAWDALSDSRSRQDYDRANRSSIRATGRIVSARRGDWGTPDRGSDAIFEASRGTQVADAREMKITGLAKLLRPIPLILLGLGLAAILVLVTLLAGSADNPTTDRPASGSEPEGLPLGCIDLIPRTVEVPCGAHDAVFWSVIQAQESCASGLEPLYRDGEGGLFCITRVE